MHPRTSKVPLELTPESPRNLLCRHVRAGRKEKFVFLRKEFFTISGFSFASERIGRLAEGSFTAPFMLSPGSTPPSFAALTFTLPYSKIIMDDVLLAPCAVPKTQQGEI